MMFRGGITIFKVMDKFMSAANDFVDPRHKTIWGTHLCYL